jgi:acetyltransferase-like isoleucine patch superfamily enzyme
MSKLYNRKHKFDIIRLHHEKVLSDVRVSNTTVINDPMHLFLEDNIFIGHLNFLECSNEIHLKEGVQITSHCVLTTHSSHISIRLYGKDYTNHSDHIGYRRGSIEIGKYSFIGSHSTIMPNTKLGKGCLVKAYSYVSGEFPDYSIIAGNPAEVVGDTRELDAHYLENNEELQKLYNEWIK